MTNKMANSGNPVLQELVELVERASIKECLKKLAESPQKCGTELEPCQAEEPKRTKKNGKNNTKRKATKKPKPEKPTNNNLEERRRSSSPPPDGRSTDERTEEKVTVLSPTTELMDVERRPGNHEDHKSASLDTHTRAST